MSIVLVIWTALPIGSPANNEQKDENPLRIVCATTLISSVMEAVGGEDISVHILVPSGMCPGHFDITPGEAKNLREADLILMHGFEKFLDGVEFSKQTELIKMVTKGNWMIPDVHKKAVVEAERLLSERLPTRAEFFKNNAKRYIAGIDEATKQVLNNMKELENTPVLSSDMNGEFVEWLGLRVIGVFPRDEDVSLKAMSDIVSKGRTNGVQLIVDNVQSSGKTGRVIANELKIQLVIISNFPEPNKESGATADYINTLLMNSRIVRQKLSESGE